MVTSQIIMQTYMKGLTWTFVDVQDVREEVWKESLQQKQHILKFLQHPYQQVMIQNVLLGHFQRPQTRLSRSLQIIDQFQWSLMGIYWFRVDKKCWNH